jgi:AcrR family transcriptional regulator
MARNQELNQKMRDERQEQILLSALKIFVVKGLAGTKIREIAAKAGMSLGLAYHYYPSKEEIFTELLRIAYGKMNRAILDLEKQPITPRKKIRMAIESMLEDLNGSENFGWYCLLISQAAISLDIPPEARAIIDREKNVAYEAMERIILAGQRDGSIKHYDARDMSLVFWTSINGLAVNKAVQGDKFQLPDVSILARMFM